MSRHRLVLLVEGPGDEKAVPALVKRLIPSPEFAQIHLDPRTLRIGEYSKVVAQNGKTLRNQLRNAKNRPQFAGALVVLDGDSPLRDERGNPFCGCRAGRKLAAIAVEEGAGRTFSFAAVFACMEFESWIIASIDVIGSRTLAPSGLIVPAGLIVPQNPEVAPRGAKEWLRDEFRKHRQSYSAVSHQAELAALIDVETVRRRMPSFRRLDRAVNGLIHAIKSGVPVSTPGSHEAQSTSEAP